MAKRKSTDDFDLDMKLPTIKRSPFTDDTGVEKAVASVAKTDGAPAKSTSSANKTTKKKKPQPKKDELQLLPKKRLTVDIPHYMNEALREYCYQNRLTIKEVVHTCLHDVLKIKAPK